MKRLSLFPLFISLITLAIFTNVIAQDKVVTHPNGKKVILHPDKTWEYYEGISYDYDFSTVQDNKIPNFLRQGISASKETITTAIEMYLQGWRYTMPSPKSPQAAWGNSDGRTTWYMGYWHNKKTNKYSSTTPRKQSNGNYYGDDQNQANYWRKGGSPSYPTKIEWLLSSSGGVRP